MKYHRTEQNRFVSSIWRMLEKTTMFTEDFLTYVSYQPLAFFTSMSS